MKQAILFIAVMSNIAIANAQYDYFSWTKTTSYNGTIAAGSGLAIDQYNRCYYINTSNRVFWMYGELLSSSPAARSSSNLVQLNDVYGDHLFYIRNDNKIGVIEYLYSNGTYTNNTTYVTDNIASNSSIAANSTNQIFYIRASDRKVCNFWKNSGGSGYGPLNNSAPIAAAGSNIIINDGNIFYVTTTHQICQLRWNQSSSTWDNISLPNSPGTNSIASSSKIQITGNNNAFTVFYLAASNNKINSYYYTSTSSGFAPLGNDSRPAFTSTDIVASYNECRYVGNDGNIYSIFYDGCSWSAFQLNNTCNISSSTPALSTGTSNTIFFNSNNTLSTLTNQSQNSGFVYKQGSKLMLNGAPYTTIGLNYIAAILSTDNGQTFFPGPNQHYNYDWTQSICTNSSNCETLFDQQLAEIASLGFTSIRFNNISVISNQSDHTDPNLYIEYYNPNQSWTSTKQVLDQATINKLFSFYDNVLSKTTAHGLKVKFFVGLAHGELNTNCQAAYNNYLQQFATHFKNNTGIYAYAILEEPDFNARIHPTNNSAYRGKGDICQYMSNHYNTIRANDPNHLVTIALANGPLCERNFDPYILKVDFLSFHIYPTNKTDYTYEDVRKNIQWVSNIMKPLNKPWMLGETGFPGNNETPPIAETGSYSDQKLYGKFILDEAFSAGASAVAWWQYHDVFWPKDLCCADPQLTNSYPWIVNWANAENYFGIKSHNGTLKALVGGAGASPTSNIFQNYVPTIGCTCLYPASNYYNSMINPVSTISGVVTDQNGYPIKDALIWGVTTSYSNSNYTLTKADGSYSLESNFNVQLVHISGLGYISKTNNSSAIINTQLFPVVCGQGNARMDNTMLESNNVIETTETFEIFPNPNQGNITLSSKLKDNNDVLVEIIDLFGATVYKQKFSGFKNEAQINLLHFKAGIYFIRIETDGYSETKKLIKE